MSCFKNVLTTFLGLECGSPIAVNAGSENSDLIKNNLICRAPEKKVELGAIGSYMKKN